MEKVFERGSSGRGRRNGVIDMKGKWQAKRWACREEESRRERENYYWMRNVGWKKLWKAMQIRGKENKLSYRLTLEIHEYLKSLNKIVHVITRDCTPLRITHVTISEEQPHPFLKSNSVFLHDTFPLFHFSYYNNVNVTILVRCALLNALEFWSPVFF